MRRTHRMDHVEDIAGQGACGLELGVESRALRLGRQLAVREQVARFLEARMLGEVVDRITAVAQLARAPVDEANGGAVEVDPLEAAVNVDLFGFFSHGWNPARITRAGRPAARARSGGRRGSAAAPRSAAP